MTVQVYEKHPFLIDDWKFDLRLYVLVTSVDPLRVYIYKEGIVWFCSEVFSLENIEDERWQYIHLTNYAINKTNSESKVGVKTLFSDLLLDLKDGGHNVDKLNEGIHALVIKTLISA